MFCVTVFDHLLLFDDYRHPNSTVVIPSLRAIGNILTGSDPLAQVVINCSVLPVLKNLITSTIDQIKKETCWALSNITAGNKVQIQVHQ